MRRIDTFHSYEHGGVSVMVAILLVVVFGMGALVVDVGNMFWERRQLQNGADAAALALAAQCAEGVVECATGAANLPPLTNAAEPYADANADDDASAVPPSMTHGLDAGDCEPGAEDALNPLTDGSGLVKVSTETLDGTNGNSFLSHWLAPVLGIDATTVMACAVAGWGDYPGSLATFPLTISACEYDASVTTTYPGPHPNGIALREKILFHAGTGGDEDPCNAQAGQDTDGDGFLPAGFGWLETDGSCEIVTNLVDGDEWVDKDPGNNPECSDVELASLLNTVVQIPVFNDFCRPAHDAPPACPDYSNADKYRIQTYASFYLEGYRFSANVAGSGTSCAASESCIVGYFTESVTLDGAEGGGPEGGVIIVELED